MWVNRMPAPLAPSWTPGRPRLPPIVSGAPNNMLGRYDNTMGAVSGQAQGAVGGAATGAKVGSVFGPIGTGVGAVVGGIVGAIFGGHADHAKINADVNARKQLFSQYLTVAGTIPGRAIGIERLRDIWKGAGHMGHFPGWGGREQHIDGAVGGWHTTLDNWRKHHPATSAPQPIMRIPQPVMRAQARFGARLQGLGDLLGDVGVDAKTLVDSEWWPGNQWAVGTDAIGMQVIYDSADAYLASVDPSTPPSIGAAYSAAPTQAAPAPPPPVAAGPVPAIQPSGPVQQATVPGATLPTQQTGTPTATAPVVPQQQPLPATPPTTTIVPVPATSAGTPDISALVRQLMAQGQSAPQAYGSAMSSLQAAGIQPTPDVQQETAQAVQAAGVGSSMPGWVMLLLAGGALMFATARPAPRRDK